MATNKMVGIKIVTSRTKDGNFKNISPARDNPQNPYTNPAKADKTKEGTPRMKGKLGG